MTRVQCPSCAARLGLRARAARQSWHPARARCRADGGVSEHVIAVPLLLHSRRGLRAWEAACRPALPALRASPAWTPGPACWQCSSGPFRPGSSASSPFPARAQGGCRWAQGRRAYAGLRQSWVMASKGGGAAGRVSMQAAQCAGMCSTHRCISVWLFVDIAMVVCVWCRVGKWWNAESGWEGRSGNGLVCHVF